MKKMYLVTMFFVVAVTASGQNAGNSIDESDKKKVVFGVKAGVNIASFNASVNSESESRLGLNLGIFLRSELKRNVYFRPELYYSGQGQQDNFIVPPSGQSIGSTTTSMHYVNVPFLFEFGKRFTFHAGPQFGILLKSREKGTVQGMAVDADLKDVTRKLDMGIAFGFGFSPVEKLNIGARLHMGLRDIYTGDDAFSGTLDYPSLQHRVLHFYIGTTF
jgi:hypothetical protein